MRFAGKVAIVTGGGAGIGRATSLRLAREGAAVVVLDIAADTAAGTVAAIAEAGGQAVAHAGSVNDEQAIAAALALTTERFGKLDVLVNNAGFALKATLPETQPTDWDREFDGNVRGAWLCARAALPLLEATRGNIVNVGSVNGLMYFGNPAYSAAKGALLSLTRSLAVEYGPRGVRTNMVSPGTIQTGAAAWTKRIARDPNIFAKLSRWYPVGRVGTPEDIAHAICFLACDEAGFINGSNLVVDGGLTAGMPIMANELLAERD